MQPQVLLDVVGLTSEMLPHAPRLHALASSHWHTGLIETLPAVTCSAQATLLTGTEPEVHGIVGNGWLFRDTMEVRFWQQSNRLLEAEPLYRTARRRARGRKFTCAKLFWWFNQGAAVDFSLTPKPYYAADGNKAFGIIGTPTGLAERVEQRLGPFPFFSFWGPRAGLPCTQWIARATATVLAEERPDLTLAYLPHLDYETQRQGPDHCDLPRLVRELDDALEPVLDEAQRAGANVWVVSECSHVPVKHAIEPNRALRRAGLLQARPGPFGENLDVFGSRAFAVCDHQVAHVYVQEPEDIERVRQLLGGLAGVAQVTAGEGRRALGLFHERAGDLVALAAPDAWFAYPFWLDDREAPDYARTVDIHRKPGYDPCELFLDHNRLWPQGRVLMRLLQKKLGFRALFDVIPLDSSLVRGSHGLRAAEPARRPLLIGAGPNPGRDSLPMSAVRDLILSSLDLTD